MQAILKDLEGITYLEKSVTMLSTLKDNQLDDVNLLAEAVVAAMRPVSETVADSGGLIDATSLFNISYGLFILHTQDSNGKDNACVVNSFIQCADKPQRVMLSVNKLNYSHDLVAKTGVFNISILTEETPFSTIKRFGFASGRNGDKMAGFENELARSANGLYYIKSTANSFISCRVLQSIDCGSHTLFVCEVTEAKNLCKKPSLTYAYYFANIKPKPIVQEKKIGWRCKICGYFYEGKDLPKDFVCPICKHGAEDFEKVGF
jgi:flavin reductase (DIM6/NTAB) family NADH-FMN oxidoreductase RutF/rubredoxin